MEALGKNIIALILDALDLKSLCRIAQTCRTMRDLSSNLDRWQRLFDKEIVAPVAFVEGDNDKMTIKERIQRARRFASYEAWEKAGGAELEEIEAPEDATKKREREEDFEKYRPENGTLYFRGTLTRPEEAPAFVFQQGCHLVGVDGPNKQKAQIVGLLVVIGTVTLRNIAFSFPPGRDPQQMDPLIRYGHMWLFHGDPKVLIEDCTFQGLRGGKGAAVLAAARRRSDDSHLTVRNCEFRDLYAALALFDIDGLPVRISNVTCRDGGYAMIASGNGATLEMDHFTHIGSDGINLSKFASIAMREGQLNVAQGSQGVNSCVVFESVRSAVLDNFTFKGGIYGVAFVNTDAVISNCKMTSQVGCGLQVRTLTKDEMEHGDDESGSASSSSSSGGEEAGSDEEGANAEKKPKSPRAPKPKPVSHVKLLNCDLDGGTGDAKVIIEEGSSLVCDGLHITGAAGAGIQVQGHLALARSAITSCGGKGLVVEGTAALDDVTFSGCKHGAILVKARAGLAVASTLTVKASSPSCLVELEEGAPSTEVEALQRSLAERNVECVIEKVEKQLRESDYASPEAFIHEVLIRSRATKQCVKKFTGPKFYPQPKYDCYSCNLTEERGMGLCGACRDEHSALGHRVGPTSRGEGLFFCDCNCTL